MLAPKTSYCTTASVQLLYKELSALVALQGLGLGAGGGRRPAPPPPPPPPLPACVLGRPRLYAWRACTSLCMVACTRMVVCCF